MVSGLARDDHVCEELPTQPYSVTNLLISLMSKLSQQDVEHVASLARIELSEKKKEQYAKEMSDILSYVEKLNELNTDGVEPIGHITGMINVYRKDSVEKREREQEGIMKNVPETKKRNIVVKKVL